MDRYLPVTFVMTVLAACGICAPALSEAPASPTSGKEAGTAIDAVFSQFDKSDAPGCAVGVIRDGRFLYKRAYGMANLGYEIPLATSSIFRIGSVSKQFTAMSILLLVEQGKMSLDADVHEYLPDLMDYGYKVTIGQMLNHTSGMSDYGDDPELFPNAMGKEFRWGNEDYLSTPEFYSRVKNVPLRHPPGTRFLYSNFAYFLLSQVVESVSGKSLRDFAAENIFLPLGMTHTQFNDDVNRVINNEAVGYHKKADGQYELFMTNLPWVGDGGVYTSIDDFLAWDQNYYHNRLGEGRQELIDIMQTPGPHARETGDEGKIGYAMGLEISENHGHRQIAHSGSWVAFTSYYARIPDLNFSVIAMCNSDQASAGALGKQVVDIYLE